MNPETNITNGAADTATKKQAMQVLCSGSLGLLP